MIRQFISRILRGCRGHSGGGVQPQVIPFSSHGIHRDIMSAAALKVTSVLQRAGFSAFVVGGAVRDALLGRLPKDFDVATDATPEQVRHLFRRARIIGKRFRIVHVPMGGEIIEVTTFRGGQQAVTDEAGRIVSDNVFGTQAEDAGRRDFTANALFYDPHHQTIIDYHHGVRDIQHKKLVMIGEPAQRYREDPVRILRAVRLSAKLGMTLEERTQQAIADCAQLLQNVPSARLLDELLKMFFSGHAATCMTYVREMSLPHGIFVLFDVMLSEDPAIQKFVRLALENTDRRIQADQPVSASFLLAILLWPRVEKLWRRGRSRGMAMVEALQMALFHTEQDIIQAGISRRSAAAVHEIWLMQPRFELRFGARPFKLLEQARFRAAYDFLGLRAAVGWCDADLVTWWMDFQAADAETRRQMLQKDPKKQKKAQTRKRRRPSSSRQKLSASNASDTKGTPSSWREQRLH